MKSSLLSTSHDRTRTMSTFKLVHVSALPGVFVNTHMNVEILWAVASPWGGQAPPKSVGWPPQKFSKKNVIFCKYTHLSTSIVVRHVSGIYPLLGCGSVPPPKKNIYIHINLSPFNIKFIFFALYWIWYDVEKSWGYIFQNEMISRD